MTDIPNNPLLKGTSAGQMALRLDAMDGKVDGKIDAKTWNVFVKGKGGKNIEKSIDVNNAMNSITTYALKNSKTSNIGVNDLMNKWFGDIASTEQMDKLKDIAKFRLDPKDIKAGMFQLPSETMDMPPVDAASISGLVKQTEIKPLDSSDFQMKRLKEIAKFSLDPKADIPFKMDMPPVDAASISGLVKQTEIKPLDSSGVQLNHFTQKSEDNKYDDIVRAALDWEGRYFKPNTEGSMSAVKDPLPPERDTMPPTRDTQPPADAKQGVFPLSDIRDENDRVICDIYYNSDNGSVENYMRYEYDGDSKQPVKSIKYDSDGNVLSYSIHEYRKGKETKEICYKPNGDVDWYNVSGYDDKENKTIGIRYEPDGNFKSYTCWQYDESGNVISESKFDSEGQLIREG